MDEIMRRVLALMEALPAEMRTQAERTYRAKSAQARMLPFFKTVAELANEYQVIPPGDEGHRHEAFRLLVSHVEHLWDDAVSLFSRGSYPTAFFLGVVVVEELGKVAIAKVQAVLGVPSAAIVGVGKRGAPLRSHPQKHVLAAGAGAVVNSRLDRIVGIDNVIDFIERAESGALERQRQDCLYYDVDDDGQHLPYKETTREEAQLVLTIAGELLAEVGAMDPDEWERLLRKIERFEAELR
jgi:AbiV family abortive infection protein